MFLMATQTLDELGRIALPAKIRQSKKWESGDSIAFYELGDSILINLYEKAHEPKCIMCGKAELDMHIGKFSFCTACVALIKSELKFA